MNVPLRSSLNSCSRRSTSCGAARSSNRVKIEGVSGGEENTGGGVQERTKAKTEQKEPTAYHVVLLNDDYTPMMFVIEVLEDVFLKPPTEAYRIMMQVHVNGRGVAGSYPWEIAETKADKVASLARENGFPLKATVEEA